jgi:hypothetical protein
MPGGSRSLPGRPNLRHPKLEARRRLAAGEFPALHEAQAAIAREHGLPSWAVLKQRVNTEQDSHALARLRWVISRFSGAADPGWTAPADDELRQHFDGRFLTVLPPSALVAAISRIATELRDGELVVLQQTPLQAYVQLGSMQYIAVAEAEPPHRLTGLRGVPEFLGPVIACSGPRGERSPNLSVSQVNASERTRARPPRCASSSAWTPPPAAPPGSTARATTS